MAGSVKKITLLIDEMGYGGAQTQIVKTAQALARLGHTCEVVYYNILPKPQTKTPVDIGCSYLFSPSSNYSSFGKYYRLLNYFRKDDSDIIIAFLRLPSVVAECAKILGFRGKVIVSERNMYVLERQIKFQLRAFLHKRADVLYFNSAESHDYFLNRSYWSHPNTRLIPNIMNMPSNLSGYRGQIPTTIAFVALAKHSPQKNVECLVEGFRKITNDLSTRIRLEIFGSGYPMYGTLAAEDNVCDVPMASIKVNQPTNIERILPNFDYFVSAAHFEGSPNAVVEALSWGLPVILSDLGQHRRIVEEFECGWLFDASDPLHLAHCLESAMALTRTEYKTLREKAYRAALEIVRKNNDLFDQAINDLTC